MVVDLFFHYPLFFPCDRKFDCRNEKIDQLQTTNTYKHLQTLTKLSSFLSFSELQPHTQLHSASHDLYRYCLVPGRACRSHRVPDEEAEGRS
jgi:hypothetical protein